MKLLGLLVTGLAALTSATPTDPHNGAGLSDLQKGPPVYQSQPTSSSQVIEAKWAHSKEAVLESMNIGTTLTKRAAERAEPTGEAGGSEWNADRDMEHSSPKFEANHNIAPPRHVSAAVPSAILHSERRGLKNETQSNGEMTTEEFLALFSGSDNDFVEMQCKYEYQGCISPDPFQGSKQRTCSCNVSKLGRCAEFEGFACDGESTPDLSDL